MCLRYRIDSAVALQNNLHFYSNKNIESLQREIEAQVVFIGLLQDAMRMKAWPLVVSVVQFHCFREFMV